jgi:hypothetical protein
MKDVGRTQRRWWPCARGVRRPTLRKGLVYWMWRSLSVGSIVNLLSSLYKPRHNIVAHRHFW